MREEKVVRGPVSEQGEADVGGAEEDSARGGDENVSPDEEVHEQEDRGRHVGGARAQLLAGLEDRHLAVAVPVEASPGALPGGRLPVAVVVLGLGHAPAAVPPGEELKEGPQGDGVEEGHV